ncbi:MAG: GNAT family N-acetyltransferase [Gemmatimonadales bacterium]
MLIRESVAANFTAMLALINDAAHAYRGVIPVDRWREPYMSAEELAKEIADGVVFWVAEQQGRLSGVMAIQDRGDVALVRHAYVAPTTQRTGVGTRLLRHVLEGLTDEPILIGTWAAASWAIEFYRRAGSPSSRAARRTGCSERTGQSPRDRSKRRWSLPIDGGWRPNARSAYSTGRTS